MARGLRWVVGVSDAVLSDLAELQRQAAALAELVATQNVFLIRKLGRRRIPPLYSSGVVYRFDPEEWEHPTLQLQYFPDALQVVTQGFVDCKGAVPFRLADLRLERPTENFAVYAYPRRTPHGMLIHLQVRLPSGEIEDPSRFLQH